MLKYALITGLLLAAPFTQTADAFDMKKIAGLAKAGKQKFCRQGSFFSGVISVRSFEGALCLHPGVAALAMKVCKKDDGFMDSKCAKNAQNAIGSKNPDTVLAEEKAKDP